jgi:hypothetical protein
MLEHQADLGATLIARNRSLPPDFIFSPAPAGMIQCHQGPSCPGTPVGAGDRTVWMPANGVIEDAYKAAHPTSANAIFFGSQFESGRDVLPPANTPNRKFAVTLLRHLRGLVNQRRPDIIDFHDRVFYEIKTVGYISSGTVQVQSYYVVADEIRRQHAFDTEPPWRIEYATWYPPHVLPFPPDPLRKIVCTQATDHDAHPALILYEVRQLNEEEEERRRMRMVVSRDLTDFDQQFTELAPRIRDELKLKLRMFDPENPEYVIIVPQPFYRDWQRIQSDKMIDRMRVKLPPFLDSRNPIGQFRIIGWTMIGLYAGAMAVGVIIAGASLLAPAAAGGAAVAGGAAAGGAAGGGAEVISLAAYRALQAAPVAKELAAAAGVLLVLGTVTSAKADSATIGDIAAIRYVPVSDFQPHGGVQTAVTRRASRIGLGVCQDTKGKFNLGTQVMFDSQPHNIIGQFIAR